MACVLIQVFEGCCWYSDYSPASIPDSGELTESLAVNRITCIQNRWRRPQILKTWSLRALIGSMVKILLDILPFGNLGLVGNTVPPRLT